MRSDLWAAMVAFVVSGMGAALTLSYTRRAGLVDIPNARSSHTVPTPRGGGIALVAAVLLVTGYELALGGQPHFFLIVIAGAPLLLALVGWLDDRDSMPVKVRLLVHIACGLAVAFLVNAVAPLTFPSNITWLIWWAFWTVASINIVNFMDGIDGMVASQGIVYGVFLTAMLPSGSIGSRFGVILAGACFGFLLWNWAPARIFLGDVGSGPLGLFFVIGGVLAMQAAPAALVFLPLFPLFLDALVTLLRRLRKGERVTMAHRSHLYQRLANNGRGHALVTSAYALAAAIGAIVAVVVRVSSPTMIGFAIMVYCFAISVAWVVADQMLRRATTPANAG
jgi:UDP-N-acetylmuramyl pentapeptide phosphotransferase/UDP-N-acetylglucosamine-1-phosphate transferase